MLSEASSAAKLNRRALLGSLTSLGHAQPSRPNVLILFTDDQRADTIGAWGNRNIDTPNLNRLVKTGTSFRNCYNQGGHQPAVCVASRAMLLSGRSLWRATAPTGLAGPLLPERFAEAGYRTFFTGKWHNGAETLHRSFQSGGLTHLGGMGPQINPQLNEFGTTKTFTRDGRATGLFTDELTRFLNSDAKSQHPFFAFCAFTAPHDPREAAKEDLQRYQGRQLPLPRPWAARPGVDNGELLIRDEMVVPAPRTREQCQQELAAYYALITELDRNIGKILKVLEATQQLNNTIIVFASDNGLAMGAHGLMGKQSMYEHSLRVPLVMSGPGIKARTEVQPVYLYEVYHRLCSHLKLSIPPGIEGGQSSPLYFAYRDFQRAIRIGSRKMSWSGNSIEQYDLAKDPHEEHNLFGTPSAWPEAQFRSAQDHAKIYFGDQA